MKFLFLIFLAFIVFTSCSKENRNYKNYIKINSDLIGDLTKDSSNKIQYNPPKEWNKLDPVMFKMVMDQIGENLIQGGGVSTNINNIYLNRNDGAFQIVSNVFFAGDTDFKSAKEMYYDMLVKKIDTSQLKISNYIKDGFKIMQIQMNQFNTISIKLLIDNNYGSFLEFDYIIPKDTYKKEINSVESSIASILKYQNNSN